MSFFYFSLSSYRSTNKLLLSSTIFHLLTTNVSYSINLHKNNNAKMHWKLLAKNVQDINNIGPPVCILLHLCLFIILLPFCYRFLKQYQHWETFDLFSLFFFFCQRIFGFVVLWFYIISALKAFRKPSHTSHI